METRFKLKVCLVGLFWAVLALSLTGCQTASFYSQAVRGQCALLRGRQFITQVLVDPTAPDALKQKLNRVLDLRQFAARELNLPVGDHYLTYVDLKRRFAVWNVHAAPEFSLEPKGWWYPFVGRLSYRGYFSENDALEYAARLKAQGYDVHVEGVETYSTLGWFDDPALNTFVHHREITLAEILFHELAHQKLFVNGDTDFNEAFASAVAEEGVQRWLRQQNNPEAIQRYEKAMQRQRQFVALILKTRARLESLYSEAERSRSNDASPRLREMKFAIFNEMRSEYGKLKAQWDGYSGYDPWFDQTVNNAQLNSVAAYYDLVPAFHRLLKAHQNDLSRFYQAVRQLARLPKSARHSAIKTYAVNPRFEL